MKNTIKLAVSAAMVLGATSAFATNGDNLIGTGAKSRAMGGTGIAHSNGAESATTNPALITKNKGVEFTFGGTYFRPDVSVSTDNTAGTPSGPNVLSADSDAKHNVIPYVALTHNLENGFVVGASMYGSAGMGTDWRDSGAIDGTTGTPNLWSMRSNLLLLKFSVPIAYGQDNWSVGIAPVMMYGALDISFDAFNLDNTGNPIANAPATKDVGNGSSSDFGLGYEIGAQYTLTDMGVTIAAKYLSAISMTYDHQISSASEAFGYGQSPVGLAAFADDLEQPAEIGLGLDWTQGDISVAFDYKNVGWGSAKGYKDFNWEDQDVFALGAEYRMDALALRLGFNYASNPIKESTDGTGVLNTAVTGGGTPATGGPQNGHVINAFNAVMFPAITETHYTIGAGYKFSERMGADFAFTYATSGTATYAAQTVALGNVSVENDQIAVSANLNYAF